VIATDRGRYTCVVAGREAAGQEITAMKARELVRGSVVVGDMVSLAGDVTGDPGSLARIVRVSPRTSVLRRSADDTDPVERVIVANADQLGIVTALADPPPRPRLIDRFLVAAYDAGLDPLLLLTKADLADPAELLATYAPLGLRYLVSGRPLSEAVLDRLREQLAGQISVLVGHSGVGKSTLVNALSPDAGRAVGTVSPVTGRGRHTSSSVVALRLPRSPTWPTGSRSARRAATTWARTAPWTTGSPSTTTPGRWPPGWTRCGGCWPAGRATTPERSRSPGVRLGRRPARAGEDLVQPLQHAAVQRDLEGVQGPVELAQRTGPHDRRGDRGLMQQPGQAHLGRILADLGAQRLVRLDLRPHLGQGLGGPPAAAAARPRLLGQDAGQQAAVQRAPGQHAQAVALAGGQHLEFDRAHPGLPRNQSPTICSVTPSARGRP
jgi:ribosome biogenesis GTPase